MNRSITVLHLSDLQFGLHHRFGGLGLDTLLDRLAADLRGLRDRHGLEPDLLVLTGDLAEWGKKSEFDDALRLVEGLTAILELERHCVVVVPGNHDVNRKLCEGHFLVCEGRDETPCPPYWPKWEPWINFFERFYRDVPQVSFTEAEPWSFFVIEELQVVVAGLNSTMAESHRDEDHYGEVGERQLEWFRERLSPYEKRGWLRIGAVHHNAVRGAVEDDENLRDEKDLKRILGAHLHLLLHGHTHEADLSWLAQNVPVLSTGSAALGQQARPEEVPNQYQVLRIETDRLQRWSRQFAPDQKRWIADPRVSSTGDVGHAEYPVLFEIGRRSVLDVFAREEHFSRDDFLSRVERICRLRSPDGTDVRQIRSDSSRLEYLSVTEGDGTIARIYPVGAVRGEVSAETLDAFLDVHRRYRQTDPGVRSTLVYGGRLASEDLVRRAAGERVRLRSFVEYQGLIDFRNYLEKQTRKLAEDPRYPPSLYVPQRIRYKFGQEEHVEDAYETVRSWLRDDLGRFVLVLGDFGTGKTFLLHEIARRMGNEADGAMTPVLIEMRDLEKGHNLDALVAQHLARSGMERIDLKAFRYMLEQGRIVLLFDGFDELALRVTYDRAAEHFSTLVEAARGDAKIVVTSRTQHFESDRQIKTALGERVDLLAGHRITRLQPFEKSQIRRFLKNRLGRDEAAEKRFQLIDEIKDLLGLSSNPRMLGFIAELSEEELRAAREREGEITSAELYRILLERWLIGEYERHQPKGALPALTVEERWSAVTELALCLWKKTERSVNVRELEERVGQMVVTLTEGLSEDVAAHQVGSGTLLVRDAEGEFSFIHQSVLEWLVAREASRELEHSGILEQREISSLMADFLIGLAGRDRASAWASEVVAGESGEIIGKNALLVFERLHEAVRTVLQVSGQDFRGQDLAGRDLSGSDLRNANLSSARLIETRLARVRLNGANLSRADLSRAVLSEADLRGANLSSARLMGADLRGARLEGCRLGRAMLVGAQVTDGSLRNAELFGAALPQPDSLGPWISGAPWKCYAVDWSPDRTLLVSGHQDGSVRLWDPVSGDELRRFHGHQAEVRSVAWSPDGQRLASGSFDHTLRVWEVETGREICILEGHQGRVLSVAWSLDGQRLASGALDQTVRVWEAKTGCEILTLEGHRREVWSVTWSPDGQRLASGALDQTVRIWEIESGYEIRTLEGHRLEVRSVAWSPDGQHLASGSSDRTVRVWDAKTGYEIHTLEGHQGKVLSVAWSRDSRRLVSGSSDQTVRLWEVATGREVRNLEGHQAKVRSVAWSRDGQRIASASDDVTVRVWDAETGREICTFEGHPAPVLSVVWSPDGHRIASGSFDQTVRLWEAETGREIRTLGRHPAPVLSVAWSPDGQRIASASFDQTVRLWEVETGREIRILEGHQARVLSVAWSPDGHYLASGDSDRHVRLWEAETGRETWMLLGHLGGVLSLAWSPDGRRLASGSSDQTVRLWEVKTGREICILEGHRTRVWSVAWGPDGRLASGAGDKVVRLWKVDTGRETHTIEGHQAEVLSVAWSPDGQHLASGSDDHTVRLWETETGREILIFEGHQAPVRSVEWSPDGHRLASGAADNTIRIWDAATGGCLAILASFPEGWVAFTPEGRYKLGGETSGRFWHTISLCRFEPGELDPYWPEPLRMADDEPFW